jgi:hypothetical protein
LDREDLLQRAPEAAGKGPRRSTRRRRRTQSAAA